MYKIISIKDKNGVEKTDFYNELQAIHPNMSGEILCPEWIRVGGHFCLIWDDDTGKMLRTSTIEKYIDSGDIIEVVTRNSIYTLKRENNNM